MKPRFINSNSYTGAVFYFISVEDQQLLFTFLQCADVLLCVTIYVTDFEVACYGLKYNQGF